MSNNKQTTEVGFENDGKRYRLVLGKSTKKEDENYYLQIYAIPKGQYMHPRYMVVNARIDTVDLLNGVK